MDLKIYIVNVHYVKGKAIVGYYIIQPGVTLDEWYHTYMALHTLKRKEFVEWL